MLQSIILLVILIFLNATFASAEIAVISMNSAKLRKMTSEGDVRAKKLSYLTQQPARFLATIQVAITLAGLLQSAFAADNFADPLVAVLVSAGVPISESILKNVSIIIITLILAYFNLVFGELVPKRLAMKKADSMALGMARMLYAVSKICKPVVWLLTVSTNGILKMFGMNPEEEDDKVTEEEIRMMLLEGNEQGTIQEEENNIIQNVFEFDDISVEEICTHRRDVVILDIDDSDKEWEETIFENRHTFYPICGRDSEDIIGILDTRDYFRLSDKSKKNLMDKAVDQPMFVPETMRANRLFRKMKESRSYFAVILDEYGALSGIITLHDLLEALVGELNEEEDPVKVEDIRKLNDDTWKIQGCAALEDVAEELDIELPVDEYDTFSGYICGVIGRVPDDDERFQCKNDLLDMEIHYVKNHIIGDVTVKVKQKQETA
ncbi:MAG: hemolysin family protein [Monoglobales bacterium]